MMATDFEPFEFAKAAMIGGEQSHDAVTGFNRKKVEYTAKDADKLNATLAKLGVPPSLMNSESDYNASGIEIKEKSPYFFYVDKGGCTGKDGPAVYTFHGLYFEGSVQRRIVVFWGFCQS